MEDGKPPVDFKQQGNKTKLHFAKTSLLTTVWRRNFWPGREQSGHEETIVDVQGRVTAFTRTKFLSRKPVPTPLQALGRVTSNRKFHRDKHSSSVQRCFQAAGNLSSRCVYEMCGAWECLPLSWLLSVTPWDSPWPGKPSDLDQCLSVCEEGPGIVFPFSSLSQADAFIKHNNDKLLGKRNEKVKKTKMWTLFLILRNKRKRTPSISAVYLWESADCPSPQPVLMSRGRGETQESRRPPGASQTPPLL